jgi:ribosomal protein L44E
MPEHYTRNTRQVLHYCPTCNRKTMHRVDDRRLGCCLEDHRQRSVPSAFRPEEVTRAERVAIMVVCGQQTEADSQVFCDKYPQLYGILAREEQQQSLL